MSWELYTRFSYSFWWDKVSMDASRVSKVTAGLYKITVGIV